MRIRSILGSWLLILLLAVGVGAFGDWEMAPESASMADLDAIISELEESIERADANRAAHQDFLTDLRDYVEALKQWQNTIDGWSGWGDYSSDATLGSRLRDGLVFWTDFNPADYDSRLEILANKIGAGELKLSGARIGRGGPGNGSILAYSGENLDSTQLNLDLGSPQALTIAIWFYADDWGEHSAGYGRLLTDSADSDLRLFLVNRYPGYNTNSLYVQFDSYAATTEVESVTLNTWHHVALVFEDGRIRVYIDGRLQELRDYQGINESLTYNPTLPLHIGNRDAGGRQFIGSFDEILIWDRALSTPEIREVIR